MRYKALILTSILLFLSVFNPVNSFADEDDMKIILTDSLYGGAIGFVCGAAILLLDPGTDNIKVLGYGTGAGILAGTAYGIYTTSTVPIAEYKSGSLKFNLIPTIKTKVFDPGVRGEKIYSVKADIFKYRF